MPQVNRYPVLFILAVLILLAAATDTALQAKRAPKSEAPKDWRLQGGSPLRNNNYDGSVPSYPLKRIWETSLGGDVDSFAIPFGKDVFVAMEIARKNGVVLLRCKGDSGEVAWSFERRVSKLTMYPVTANGTVFIGTKNLGMNRSLLYALDAENGEKLWDFVCQDDLAPEGRACAPCVSGERLYVPSMSGLLCLSTTSGKLLWKAPALYPGAPLEQGGVIYTGNEALKAETGEKLWEYRDLDSESGNALLGPAMHQGMLISGSTKGDRIVALDAAKGTKLWEYKAEHSWKMLPCIIEGMVIINGDLENKVLALEPSTGELLWETGGKFRGNPAVAGELVYLPTEDSYLIVLDRRTGDILFRENPAADRKGKDDQKLEGSPETIFDSTLLVMDRHIFAPSRDRLFCLEQKGRKPKKSFVYKSASSKNPYEIRNGVINGALFDKATGKPVIGTTVDIHLPFALREDGTISPLNLRTVTDGEGKFSTKAFVVEYRKGGSSSKKTKAASTKIVKQQITFSLKGYRVQSMEKQLREGYNNFGRLAFDKES